MVRSVDKLLNKAKSFDDRGSALQVKYTNEVTGNLIDVLENLYKLYELVNDKEVEWFKLSDHPDLTGRLLEVTRYIKDDIIKFKDYVLPNEPFNPDELHVMRDYHITRDRFRFAVSRCINENNTGMISKANQILLHSGLVRSYFMPRVTPGMLRDTSCKVLNISLRINELIGSIRLELEDKYSDIYDTLWNHVVKELEKELEPEELS